MRWPLDKVFITQEWGENPDIYAKFGLKGHNGIDLRAANGTPVYAPHDGVIKERSNDANGYGNYLKVESDIEGSVLGHLKSFEVNINKQVKEGDLIGLSDNTGFSTGPHLHWGYYRVPRNRNDGYLGYINQKPIMEQEALDQQNDKLKELEEKVAWYEKEFPLEQQRLVDCRTEKVLLEGKVKSLQNQLEEEDNASITFIRTLASNLGTTQNTNEIIAAVRTLVENYTAVQNSLKKLQNDVSKFLKDCSEATDTPLTTLEAVLDSVKTLYQGGNNTDIDIVKPIFARLWEFIRKLVKK